jgi:hypothetical protein
MTWLADAGAFIKTGEIIQMPFNATPGVGYDEVLATLRSFPESRLRFCYELPTIRNVPYLIRASFYMSESVYNERQPFQFNAFINANLWFTITSFRSPNVRLYYFDNQEGNFYYARQEGIFYSPSNVTYICLQRGPQGDPFISSLELRELNATMYITGDGSQFQYLSLLWRYSFGTPPTSAPVR